MRRSSPTTTTTMDSGCSSYRPYYQTLSAFLDYKEAELNTDGVGNYISTTLASDLAGNTPNMEPAEMQQNIQMNLDTLQNLETKVYNMTRCLQAEITQRSERSGEIYALQERVVTEEKEAKAMEQTVKEAKERASLLEDPYSKTNRHELWFPLGKPLKPQSVPVLLSIAILLLVLSLGMFLRLASIDLRLTSNYWTFLAPKPGINRG